MVDRRHSLAFNLQNGPFHPMETRMILLAIDPYPHVVSPNHSQKYNNIIDGDINNSIPINDIVVSPNHVVSPYLLTIVSPHQMVWDFFHPHLTTNPQV